MGAKAAAAVSSFTTESFVASWRRVLNELEAGGREVQAVGDGGTMKILIIGHACSPYAGSEPGLTWNWAWHLAAENDVWLIAHPHFRGPVEEYLARHPRTRLRVHWAALPASIDPWNPVKGERGLNLCIT